MELLWDRHADSAATPATVASTFTSSSAVRFLVALVVVVVVVHAMSPFHDSAAPVSLTDFEAPRAALAKEKERGEKDTRETGP